MEKLCEGPHVDDDFQPARSVARLQGILLPITGRDGSVANFCFNSIRPKTETSIGAYDCRLAPERWGNRPTTLLIAKLEICGAALQADGETKSVVTTSSIRRRSAAWTILPMRHSFSAPSEAR
jgi:hypothetical protein